jgi:hypothetical protein
MLRTLRITGLIVCLLVRALTVVMWIRSYKQMDDAYSVPSGKAGAFSVHGLLTIVFYSEGDPYGMRFSTMRVSDVPSDHFRSLEVDTATLIRFPQYLRKNAMRSELVLPYWTLFFVFGALSAALGINRHTRFTIRQAMLAITSAAIVLGIGVGVSRLE